MPGSPNRFDEYLAWLDARSESEPVFTRYDQTESGIPVTVMKYPNLREPGETLAFTFGVSEPRAPGDVGVELVLNVRSLDPQWGHALGVLGETIQGANPEAGATCEMGAPLAGDTTMSAFVLAPPMVSTDESIEIVHLEDGHLWLRQAFPIYSIEREHLLKAADRVAATRRLTLAIDDARARPDRAPVPPEHFAD